MTGTDYRIIDIKLDERTILWRNADIEQERRVAIFDLLEGNSFQPVAAAVHGNHGPYRVGLGVEERLRVARNVRIEEEKGGFVVEGTTLEYSVSIEIASTLGMATEVEVVDRLPVTDDKNIKIKVLSVVPDSQPYTQSERGSPVRGGLRWTLAVPAGGRATIEYKYRVSFSARNELVGGSRRD